jgi:glycosyltransferase involved in cell wall biosynthesis
MTSIKLLAVIEATTVSGPAKNLLGFFRLLRSPEFQTEDVPRMEFSIVTFHRSGRLKLDDNGSSVTKRPQNAFVAAALAQGVEVDVISERFLFDPGVIGHLRKFVARRAPNVVQTHMVKSHFLTKLSGIGREYPWVAYHHGYTSTDLKMRGYNQLNRWSLPSAARVITVCGAFAEQLSKAGVQKNRIVICHNSVTPAPGIAPELTLSLREQLGITTVDRVILSVGRMSKEKGHIDLIRALAALRELNPTLNSKLVIVGEGPERQHIAMAAARADLANHVIFAGHTNTPEKYYAMADALALPSHSEGSPNVLLEAMAAGVPVVATAVGGVPEIATNEQNALLVPAGDMKGFALALNRLLSNNELATILAQAARKHVLENFSPTANARSLLRVYEELISDIT